MICVQKGGVKFSVVTGSGKEARLRSVLVSILCETFSDDGAGVHGREGLSFTDYSILTSSKGSTQPALTCAGNEDVNARNKRRLSASRWSAAAISEWRGV